MNKEVAKLLDQLYPDFNARNIEQIMPHFASDADWPNGMTGGREIGHQAIRAYWSAQWSVINSQVSPVSYRVVDNQIVLEVEQLIKDMDGNTLADSVVYHTYQFVDGKITKMDISEAVPDFAATTQATAA